jgi:hypothetical protein
VAADYRQVFWRMAWPLLRTGRIEDVIHVGMVAHHLITFARDAVAGNQNASFYSAKQRPQRSATRLSKLQRPRVSEPQRAEN